MTRERISPEGYSVTDDEFRYLQALCEGPKRPVDIAVEVSGELSEGLHRAETVAQRLAALADRGTAHLVERYCDPFRIPSAGAL